MIVPCLIHEEAADVDQDAVDDDVAAVVDQETVDVAEEAVDINKEAVNVFDQEAVSVNEEGAADLEAVTLDHSLGLVHLDDDNVEETGVDSAEDDSSDSASTTNEVQTVKKAKSVVKKKLSLFKKKAKNVDVSRFMINTTSVLIAMHRYTTLPDI